MTKFMDLTNLKDLVNGGISGMISIVFMQPLQVVKTSMMVIYNKDKKIKMLEVIKKIKSEEGIFGFYRGFIPAVLKTVLGTAIYFYSLEFNKKLIMSFYKSKNNSSEKNDNSKNKNTINFLSSGIARLIQGISTNPILVIKTRYEVVGFKSYNNIFEAFLRIKREEGLKGFYSGLKTTLLKDVPASAFFYSLYEFFKLELNNFGILNIQAQAVVSSVSASFIMIILTNPLDLIRTRQQYQFFSDNADHNYKSIFQGIKLIYKCEGYRGFAVGIVPRLIKKGSGSILVWTTYESLKHENI